MKTARAVVVGGGIIGAAVARELCGRDFAVTVVEKEAVLASHQTGHNSGVVHAGLYYEPGSLKARLCRRGALLLRDYAERNSIGYDEVGKVVVALDEVEQRRLEAIRARADANGVPDVRMVDPDGLAQIEPRARGLAALHSPRTAVVDYVQITRSFASEVVAAGGQIILDAEVTALRHHAHGTVVTTTAGEYDADLVVICAGLHSDRLAALDGQDRFPKVVPFFGDYFNLTGESAALCRGLIYPVPDPRYPFLGVHITRHIDGSVSIGPNAFLAPSRQAYQRVPVLRGGGVDLADLRDAVGFPGFWRFAAGNLRAAARESRSVLSTRSFVRQAQRYLPGIAAEDVTPGARGIRAQAMNRDGSLLDDFAIDRVGRVVHVRNAPSPGATASMAIAEHIVTTWSD